MEKRNLKCLLTSIRIVFFFVISENLHKNTNTFFFGLIERVNERDADNRQEAEERTGAAGVRSAGEGDGEHPRHAAADV